MHHNYTRFFKSFILAFSVLTATNAVAQKSGDINRIPVQTKAIGDGNYKTFYQPTVDKTPEVITHNKGYENDPELGMAFPNTPKNSFELLDKRTKKSKTFIEKGTNGTEYLMMGSEDALNYQDETGKWRTVYSTLRPESIPGVYSVSETDIPVTINTNQGYTSISIKGTPYNLQYNSNLELLYIKPDGAEQSLGTASWKDYTAGDDGAYVKNAWPGIDIEMHLIRAGVKTNFWINHAMPQYAGGKLVIRDHLQMQGGLSLQLSGNKAEIIDNTGRQIYNLSQAIAFEKENVRGIMKRLDYKIGTNNTLDIVTPGNFFNEASSAYPIVIDPVFTATGSDSLLNHGSSFDPTFYTPANGCTSSVPITVPAAVMLTDLQVSFFEGVTTGINGGSDSSLFGFINPNGGCGLTFGDGTPEIGPIELYVSNFSAFPYLFNGCAYPTPSCSPTVLNTTYWLSRRMDSIAGPCDPTDIYEINSCTMIATGHTVEINATPIATPDTICFASGLCSTLTVTPQYGVPPYSYVWTPVPSSVSSVTVCPTTTATYSVTVTDQCSNTATATATVTVNPLPPVPTVSPSVTAAFCQGSGVPLTASSGTGISYQWYYGNVASGATTQTYTATGAGTYYVAVTNTVTGCSSLSSGVTTSVNPLPLAIISPSSDTMCYGSSLSATANANTEGNALQFTGANGRYATIPLNTATNMQTSNFTVSAWINTSSIASQDILYNGTGCVQWASWYLGIGGAEAGSAPSFPGQIVFGFRPVNNDGGSYVVAPGTVAQNTWINVTSTYDGSSLKMYLNGSLVATATATGMPFSGATPLYIGQDPGCGGRTEMNGMVDDIQIWNLTKSAADIAANYNQLIAPSSTGLVAYYRFDEATGNIVYDLSNNGNNGTITNATGRVIPSTAPISGAGNANLSYLWSPATGLNTATSNSVTVSSTTTTTYTVTVTNNTTGCSNTNATQVYVLPLPTNAAPTGSPTTFCQGVLVTLSASSNSAYQWLLNGSPLTGASTGQNFTANQSGSYTVKATGANGCIDTSAPTVLNVVPLPPIIAGSNTPICPGATLQLNSSTTQSPVTYRWAGPGALTSSTSANTSVLNAQTTNSGIYTVTVTNTTSACSDSAIVDVVINPLPNISPGANPSVCLGATSAALSFSNNLPATVTTNYNYIGGPQTYTVPPNITYVTADVQGARGGSPPSGGGYGGYGGRVQGTFSVTPGEVLTLYVGSISGYNGGGPAGQLNGNAYSANGGGASDIRTGAAALTDRIVVAGGGGGGASYDNNTFGGAGGNTTGGAAGQYVDNPSAQGGTQIAGGAPGYYNAVIPGYGSFGMGGNGGDPNSGAGGGGGYYGGGGGDADGGGGGSSYVAPFITGVNMTQGYNVSDGSIALSVTANNTYSIVWNTAATTAGFSNITNAALSGTATAIDIPIPATAVATVYSGTLTVSNGTCTSALSPISITINALPPITIGSNSPICANNTLQLNSSTTQTPVTYLWTGPASITNSTGNNATVTNAQAANSGAYTVTITNTATTCSNTASVAATVNALPVITIGSNSPICANNTLQLNSSSTQTPITYLWTGPATITNSTGNNATVPNAQAANSGTYTVTVTNTSVNCSNTATIATTVNALPLISVSSNSPVCTNTTLQFFSNSNQTPVNYLWSGPAATITSSTSNNATVANAQPANSGTYTITVTNTTTACSNTATIAATVNALPPITIGSNSPVCADNTLLLNSSTTQSPAVYSWAGPATITNDANNDATVPNAQVANSGIYTVTVTNTTTTCSNTATIATTINALPVITIGANSIICANTTLQLNSSATQTPITYLWTGPAAITNSTSNNATVPNAQAINSGIYTVTVTNTNTTCVVTATLSATVNPLPPITISSNSPICAGNTLQLNSSSTQTPVSYSWTGPATITNSTGNDATVSDAQAANSGTYKVIVVNTNTTCSNSATVLATINALPPITIGSNSPICSDVTLQLNSSTTQMPVTYLWAGPAAITNATNNDATVPNALVTNSGTYTVTVKNTATTCSNTATISATVNPHPTANITAGGTTIFCNGDSVVLTANTDIGNTFEWNNGTTMVGTGSTYTAIVSGTYTVLITNTNGTTNCNTVSAPVIVTVKPIPAIPVIQTNSSICVGDTLLLNANSTTAGVNYTWMGPNGFASVSQDTLIPNAQTINTGIYSVTATLNGCTSPDGMAMAYVYPIPPVPAASNNSLTCPGTQLDLYATDSFAGSTFTWAGPNGFSSNAEYPDIPNVPMAATGYYTVTATLNGCTSAPAQTYVTIGPILANLSATKNSLCATDSLLLTFSGTVLNTITYTWDFDSANILNGSGTGPYTLSWDSSGIKTISVVASYNGCTATAFDTIMVNHTIYLYPAISRDVCVDQVIKFDVPYNTAPPVGWSWHWDFDGATILNGSGTQGPFVFEWETPGIKHINLIDSGNICLTVPPDTVTVHSLPDAKIVSISKTTGLCTGDTVILYALPGADSGYAYTWMPAGEFAGQATDTVIATIYQPGMIQLAVTDPFGCIGTDSLAVSAQVCCDMGFPTAFSPNGDGKNDYFGPVNFGHHAITEFHIVNRWGQTIFKSLNDSKKWDGTFNGVPQDIGTYFWYIKYQCSDGSYTEKSGQVTLIR